MRLIHYTLLSPTRIASIRVNVIVAIAGLLLRELRNGVIRGDPHITIEGEIHRMPIPGHHGPR